MEYPRLPFEQDRRRILTEREISEMRELRNSGYVSRRIGEIFGVSKTLVLYWTNDEAYRKRVNLKRYQLLKDQDKRDSNFKEKRKAIKKANLKDLLKRSEPKRKWKGIATYKWKKKRLSTDKDFREKTNKQALNLYHKNRMIQKKNTTNTKNQKQTHDRYK